MNTLINIPKTIITFFRSIVEELKYVQWLSWNETIRLTSLVISITVIIGFLLAVSDKILNFAVSKLLTIVN